MKVLITGSNGFLGQHLVRFLVQHQLTVIATGRGENRNADTTGYSYHSLDTTNAHEVLACFQKHKPDYVIHAAAMSKPDECNTQREACHLHNVTATQYIVDAANSINAKLIYVSTDFIFGENGPHDEDTVPAPLNFYGESKLMAEQYVKANAAHWAIMRPVFIYGSKLPGSRPSFLHWVKQNLEQGKSIKVVSDQQRTPTYVYDICKGLLAMMQQQVIGDFHLAGKDILSPYDMAIAVAKVLQLPETLIEKVTSDTFVEPVKRAKHSGLTIDKAKQTLNYNPVAFEEGVKLSLL